MRQALRGETLVPLEGLLRVGTCAGLTDGELLERFAARRGSAAEAAFTALVERHGPAVLRLCRGVLRDRHDAEDAFQATFLVLARRAGSIRRKESVGPWLRGVALRVAGCARSAATRRRRHEQAVAGFAPVSIDAYEPADGTEALLEELGRLPEKFRTPLVLCYLEGMAQDDVAERLGWPLGTVRSRLARGRERLRVRLVRRGLAPTLGAWAAWSSREASAALPPGLVKAATQAAVDGPGLVSISITTLSQEVLRAMTWTKLKVVGASVLAVGFTVAGAGVIAQQVGERSSEPKGTPDTPAVAGQTPKGMPLEASALPERNVQASDPENTEQREEAVRILSDRVRELEKALIQARLELKSSERSRIAGQPGVPPQPLQPEVGPQPIQEPQPAPVPYQEQRLRRVERILDELMAERQRDTGPVPPNLENTLAPVADADRPKAVAWEALTRGGFIGRFDHEPINAVRFLANLYRAYVGRRPTHDETAMLFKLAGPGYEQWTVEPESLVRRLLQSDWFPGTALGQALMAQPRPRRIDLGTGVQ